MDDAWGSCGRRAVLLSPAALAAVVLAAIVAAVSLGGFGAGCGCHEAFVFFSLCGLGMFAMMVVTLVAWVAHDWRDEKRMEGVHLRGDQAAAQLAKDRLRSAVYAVTFGVIGGLSVFTTIVALVATWVLGDDDLATCPLFPRLAAPFTTIAWACVLLLYCMMRFCPTRFTVPPHPRRIRSYSPPLHITVIREEI